MYFSAQAQLSGSYSMGFWLFFLVPFVFLYVVRVFVARRVFSLGFVLLYLSRLFQRLVSAFLPPHPNDMIHRSMLYRR